MPTIQAVPLPYVSSLQERTLDSIELVVIHCTELPDMATAREYGERIHYPDTATGNSGHFYIERNGEIEQWVPLERIAHHVRDFNQHSLGIELVNIGRYPDWFRSDRQFMKEPYPPEQVSALLELLKALQDKLPQLRRITGHSWLDTTRVPASDDKETLVFRKMDPGPRFPWDQVLSRVSLEWYEPRS